jgi:Ala-tRNA(Pro) deacylase
MSINSRLRDLFERGRIGYEVYNHPMAFTAHEVAEGQRCSGDRVAKVVILRVDGKLAMSVVTGNQRVDFATASASLDAREVRLATEDEFIERFPDCEIGAMPPFGHLFGLSVYVDPGVTEKETIFFNAGNHAQTVRIRYADYERLVRPRVVQLTQKIKVDCLSARPAAVQRQDIHPDDEK